MKYQRSCEMKFKKYCKGFKKFAEVPATQKEKTRAYLIAFEAEELAVE